MKLSIFLFSILLLFICGCTPSYSVKEDFSLLLREIKDDPTNPQTYYKLGTKYYSIGEYDSAIVQFNKALEFNPALSSAYFGIYCTTLMQNEDVKKSVNHTGGFYSKGLELNVLDSRDLLDTAFWYDPLFNWEMYTPMLPKKISVGHYSWATEVLVNEVFIEGFRSYFLGRYEEADEILTKSLRYLPDKEDARYFRALTRGQYGAYRGGIRDLDSLINGNKKLNEDKTLHIYFDSANLYYLRGYYNLILQEYDAAIKDFRACLLEDLGVYHAHFHLSNIHYIRKEYKEAIKELDAAIYINDSDPFLHYNKGIYLHTMKRYSKAIESYKKALELNKYTYEASLNIALIAKEFGDTKNAEKYYKLFLETVPKTETELIEKVKKDFTALILQAG